MKSEQPSISSQPLSKISLDSTGRIKQESFPQILQESLTNLISAEGIHGLKSGEVKPIPDRLDHTQFTNEVHYLKLNLTVDREADMLSVADFFHKICTSSELADRFYLAQKVSEYVASNPELISRNSILLSELSNYLEVSSNTSISVTSLIDLFRSPQISEVQLDIIRSGKIVLPLHISAKQLVPSSFTSKTPLERAQAELYAMKILNKKGITTWSGLNLIAAYYGSLPMAFPIIFTIIQDRLQPFDDDPEKLIANQLKLFKQILEIELPLLHSSLGKIPGLIHGDLHFGNIGVIYSAIDSSHQISIYDLEFSETLDSDPTRNFKLLKKEWEKIALSLEELFKSNRISPDLKLVIWEYISGYLTQVVDNQTVIGSNSKVLAAEIRSLFKFLLEE